MINTLKDNLMLAKESLKSRLVTTPRPELADRLIKHLGLRNVERVISGKPNTLIILTKDVVVKMPLDRESEGRCSVNNEMLKSLISTSITVFVPQSLDAGIFEEKKYYIESRLPGSAIDLPLSNIDEMVGKAADFIMRFHRETAKDIVIDRSSFKHLFGHYFDRLYPYLNDEYKTKLLKIESRIKGELIGESFKIVWFHGDYKAENVLFDTKSWEIRGVIDWDLSKIEGLPLLDILYLLFYRQYTLTKRSVADVLKDMFSGTSFEDAEEKIIRKYCSAIGINSDFRQSLLIMFWIHHVSVRYSVNNKTVYEIIEKIEDSNV